MTKLRYNPDQVERDKRVIEGILNEIDKLLEQYPFLRENEFVMNDYNALVVQSEDEYPNSGETANIYESLVSTLEDIEGRLSGVCEFQEQFGKQRRIYAFTVPDFFPPRFEHFNLNEIPDLKRDGLKESHLNAVAGAIIMSEFQEGIINISRKYRDEVRSKIFNLLVTVMVVSGDFDEEMVIDLDSTLNANVLCGVMDMTSDEIKELRDDPDSGFFWAEAGRLVQLTRKQIIRGYTLVEGDKVKRSLLCKEFSERAGLSSDDIFEPAGIGGDEDEATHGDVGLWIRSSAPSSGYIGGEGFNEESLDIAGFVRVKKPAGKN